MVCSGWSELELKLGQCDTVKEVIHCLEDGQNLFFVASTSASNLTDSEKLTISQITGTRAEVTFNYPAKDKSAFIGKFCSYLNYLLNSFSLRWLTKLSEDDKKRLYYSNFIYGPVLDCFLAVLTCLKQAKHLKVLQACYDVLTQFVSVGRLQQLIVDQSLARSSVQAESLSSHLCSIPDCINNRMNLLHTDHIFEGAAYSRLLIRSVMGALERLQHQTTVKYDFVGKLLGKMALLGDRELVCQSVLEFVSRGHENGAQVSEALTFVSSHHLEALVLPFLTCTYIPFNELRQYVDIVFGSKIVLIGKLATLLYHRLVFIKYFRDRRPKFLLFYPLTVREERRYLLSRTLFELLTVWGNKSSVELQPYEHHYALTESIIIAFYYLTQAERMEAKERLISLLTAGMPVHLDSNHADVRRAGMVVAEVLTQFLDLGTELQFEYEETPDTLRLKGLLEGYTEVEEVTTPPPAVITEPELAEPGVSVNTGLDSDDDEDDEELVPFGKTDKNLAMVKPPTYLKECVEILTEMREAERDFDKIEITLRTIPALLEASPEGNVDEIALEITQVVLHMTSEFYMVDFSECRKRILTKCAVVAPRTVADYLCYQFYEDNYTVAHRLDILDVIVESAKELSKLDEPLEGAEGEDTRREEGRMKPWEVEVMERLRKKTRRFNSATKLPVGRVNRFNSVCGNFFYALMNQYDKEMRTLSITEEDTLLLGRLIYTLGMVLHCAGHSPAAPTMSKTLLEFCRVFTDVYVMDEYVKQCILFSTSLVAQVCPAAAMTAEIYPQLMDIKLWAEDLLVSETLSAETTRLTVYALEIMNHVIGEGLGGLFPDNPPAEIRESVKLAPKITEIATS